MKLLSLDYDPVYGSDVTRAAFSSDTSVFDYDVVIWDSGRSLLNYEVGVFPYNPTYRGLPSLSDAASVRIVADTVRRRREFEEFLAMGRTLIIVARPPQRCYIDTGNREHSGTGRNRKTTKIIDEFDLLSALPVTDCKFSKSSGKNMELRGNGPLVALFQKYRKFIEYSAVMSNPPGEVLARIVGTDHIVSSIQRTAGNGYLIILPTVDWRDLTHEDEDDYIAEEDEEDEEDQWLPEAKQFQIDLLASVEQLTAGSAISWPPWADQYLTTRQSDLRTEVVKQQKRIEAARSKLAKLQEEKEVADSRNQLFLGTGRALEIEVKNVLELLGGTVTEPEPGRDDWKVSFPEGNAVVEVKGVKGSAAEKHAAQLEKWVAGEFEETGAAPKGILVVNAWRETPLNDRTEPSFPAQMLPYCEGRNHCLVTGLQLFIIRAEVEQSSSLAEHWRKALIETSGKVAGCDDWQAIIQLISPTDRQENS